jgi:hypothetical protein
MSTSITLDTVTNAIAALSITGVTIKDTDELPSALGLETAVLMPKPDNFLTDLRITPAELSKQNLDVRYTLHYQYFHCKIAGQLFANYAPMLDNLVLIIKAFSSDATLSGAMDNGECRIGVIGPIMDAAGNSYHGCELTIDILQFLEV